MKKFLVFGGSKGIGLSLSKLLLKEGHRVLIVSRNKSNFTCQSRNCEIIELDLLNLKRNIISEIFKNEIQFDGICFAQRYRSNEKIIINKSIEEYKVMVDATAQIMIQINEYLAHINNKNYDSFLRILIIGSSYATRVGKDQDWSYHAVKSAQLSLIKYFSINSNGLFNINMLSPGTFIKEGSESFWQDHPKNEHWKKNASLGLIKSSLLAEQALDIMTKSSIYFSGNNINLDAGLSHLYHDQLS